MASKGYRAMKNKAQILIGNHNEAENFVGFKQR